MSLERTCVKIHFIEKATHNIYPLLKVFIRKVKILKAPKLMEVNGDYSEGLGIEVDRSADKVMPEAEIGVVCVEMGN